MIMGGRGGYFQFQLLLLLLLLLLHCRLSVTTTSTSSSLDQMHSPPRVLITITAYSFQRWDCIDELLQNYRDICEGGWDVKIYFLTAANWSPRLASWTSNNLHCSRLAKLSTASSPSADGGGAFTSDKNESQSSIPFVVLKINNRSIENRIVDYSRLPAAMELDWADVFFYAEDDIILTLSHLSNWVAETRILQSLTENRVIKDVNRCGVKFACTFAIGFLRYWRKHSYTRDEAASLVTKFSDAFHYNSDKNSDVDNRKNGHVYDKKMLKDIIESSKKNADTAATIGASSVKSIQNVSKEIELMDFSLGHVKHQLRSGGQLWFESAIYDKNKLEEIPTFDKICIAGHPYISLRSSPHQASWLLLRSDILRINKTCNFLTMTWDKTWKNQGFVREYMSSYSIYSNPFHTRTPVNCMINKVIPAGKMEIFKIRHYQRSKVSKSNAPSIYSSEEEVMRLDKIGKDLDESGDNILMDRNTRQKVSSLFSEKERGSIEPLCWVNSK